MAWLASGLFLALLVLSGGGLFQAHGLPALAGILLQRLSIPPVLIATACVGASIAKFLAPSLP